MYALSAVQNEKVKISLVDNRTLRKFKQSTHIAIIFALLACLCIFVVFDILKI